MKKQEMRRPREFMFLWINAQQFAFFEKTAENVVNPIICVGHKGKKVISFAPMKRDLEVKVMTHLRLNHPELYKVKWVKMYGDSYVMDTWDGRIMSSDQGATLEISHQLVQDVLITALEGGSNYWTWFPDSSTEIARKHHLKLKDAPTASLAEKIFTAVIEHDEVIPVHDQEDREDCLGDISKESFERGLKLYAMHRGILRDDCDAEEADCFLQYAVMGEIVFG